MKKLNLDIVCMLILVITSLTWSGATIFWWVQNTFTYSSVFSNPQLTGPTEVHVGDNIKVAYYVTRFRTCELHISRLMRRTSDNREMQIQFVIQPIVADVPPLPRLSGYQAEVPSGILTPGEKSVEVDLFSRVQYFCNALDYIMPRTVDMQPLRMKIWAAPVGLKI